MSFDVKKIVYMGTPEFAVPALNILNARDDVEVVLVVSQPDRPRGRGKKMQASPVKSRALELGLQTTEPLVIKGNTEIVARLKSLEPDLIVVAAYGKILTGELLEIPRMGCVNIHASLLPKYRGAAPIHRAIIAGEKVSGVTLMYMSEGLDRGDMIAKAEVSLEGIDVGEAYEILAEAGAELLDLNLENILRGEVLAEKQDDSEASYAPPVLKEEGHVDFAVLGAEAAVNLIRGVTPKPGAYVYFDDVKVKVEVKVEVKGLDSGTAPRMTGAGEGTAAGTAVGMTGAGEGTAAGTAVVMAGAGEGTAAGTAPRMTGVGEGTVAGTVVDASAEGISVATLDGILVIDRLQAPGGKMMSAADYLRGHELPVGTRLS